MILNLLLILSCITISNSKLKSISSYTKSRVSIPVVAGLKFLVLSEAVQAITTENIKDNSISDKLLLKRVDDKMYDKFRPGVTKGDIFYPSWFAGKWMTRSTLASLDAPLGVEAFGGETVYNNVKNDFNNTLEYLSSFRALQNGLVLNDRLFNVEEIAKASIGTRCIVDDSQAPNSDMATQMHLILSPPNTEGTLYDVDLYCSDRLQFQRSLDTFDTLERTIQSVGIRRSNPPPAFRKEIETVTLYTLVNETTFTARQRTATYLSPLDPRYNKVLEKTPGINTLPVDKSKFSTLAMKNNDEDDMGEEEVESKVQTKKYNNFNIGRHKNAIAPEPEENPDEILSKQESNSTLSSKTHFKDGLFACFTNLWPSCCCVTLGSYSGGLLPMYLAAQISTKIEFLDTTTLFVAYVILVLIFFIIALVVSISQYNGATTVTKLATAQEQANAAFYSIVYIPTYFLIFYIIFLRFLFVRRMNIDETCGTTCMTGVCCTPCSLCQMARHLWKYQHILDGDSKLDGSMEYRSSEKYTEKTNNVETV